jgi:hypothetical protein
MTRSALLLFPLLSLLPSIVTACSSDSEEGATCASACANQNRVCRTNDDCAGNCNPVDTRIAVTSGCYAKLQERFNCLASTNQCNADGTLCTIEPYLECLLAYCHQHHDPSTCPD